MKDRTELGEGVMGSFVRLTGRLRELASRMPCNDKVASLTAIQELQRASQQEVDEISVAINKRLGSRAIKDISQIIIIQAFKLAVLQTMQERLLEHTQANGTRTQSTNFSIVDTWGSINACEALAEELFGGFDGMTAGEIRTALAVIESEHSNLLETFAGNFSKLGKISEIAGIMDALAEFSAARRLEAITAALDNAVMGS